jgi:archaemetzincin
MMNNRRMVPPTVPTLSRLAAVAVVLLATRGTARADAYTVCLQPLGKYDKKLLAPLERGLGAIYGFEVRRLDPRPMPEAAWYEPRHRWRADEILEWINEAVLPESGCSAVMALTSSDISVTSGEHEDWGIFGLGEIGGTASVVSSKRLTRKASRRKLVKRVLKVAIHELGHVLGLPHRETLDPDCVMNDAGGKMKTVDDERGIPCADERERIEAAHGVTLPVVESIDWAWVATGK